MQSLPDMIAEVKDLLTDHFADFDGGFMPLDDHTGFLDIFSHKP